MKGVIFDMDGTMVDNMMVHHKAWQKVLGELGLYLKLEEVHQQIHGINEEILERLFGDQYTRRERQQISRKKEEMYRDIFRKDLKLIPGCQALIDELFATGIPMVIASAAPPENVDFVLDNLGLRQYFRAIFHSQSVQHGKPHPEVYQRASAIMGFQPADCLVFEDTPTGAKAAENAGCPAVIITTTHEPGEFKELTNVIDYVDNFENLDLTKLFANR